MDRIAELLGRRSVGIIWSKIDVAWLGAVSAPVTFVLAGIRVVNDDSMVAVTVRDVRLVLFLIYENFCRPAEVLEVIAPFALAGLADLHEKLSGLREFQD